MGQGWSLSDLYRGATQTARNAWNGVASTVNKGMEAQAQAEMDAAQVQLAAGQALRDAASRAAQATGSAMKRGMEAEGQAEIEQAQAQLAASQAIGDAAARATKATAAALERAMEAQGQAEIQQAEAQLAASQALASGVGSAYNAIAGFAQSAVAALGHAVCSGIDSAAGKTAKYIANALGDKSGTQQFMLDHSPRVTDQKRFDGNVIGRGCTHTAGQSPSEVPGFRPQGKCEGKQLPKVYFVNGINTRLTAPDGSALRNPDGSQGGMCGTLQRLANRTCAEVVGVYNATEGMLPDLHECVQNIQKNSNTPSAVTLKNLLVDHAEQSPQTPLTLYAHSQGGLITQEAIASAKNELRFDGYDPVASLRSTSVKSYGTAEAGWPVGPHYEHINNTSDPVPHAIAGAQKNFRSQTFSDNDPTPTQHFTQPFANPIAAHSIDDVYISKVGEAPGPRNCKC